MFSEMFLLQLLSATTLVFFTSTYNILTLWYLAGLYLVAVGIWLLLDDGDIFVGFLWVIDLGVGLVFFIFILHYSTFLHQKAVLNKTTRELCWVVTGLVVMGIFLFFFGGAASVEYVAGFSRSWFFLISWYDYYDFYFAQTVTDLNLLREIYFYNNSFEFVLINFMLFYGVVSAVLMCFMIKRIFTFLNIDQLTNHKVLSQINATYFIRNQDFLKQQATSTGTRVWVKKKNLKL